MKYTQLDMKDGDILIEKDGTRWIPVWIYDDIKSRWLFEYVRITQGCKLHRFNPRGFYSRFDRLLRSKVYSETDIVAVIPNGSNEPIPVDQQVLDYQESEYLRSITRPFRKNINYIKLQQYHSFDDNEYIANIKITYTIDGKESWISLPPFKPGTMYKNMEINKEYTLEELGIAYDFYD